MDGGWRRGGGWRAAAVGPRPARRWAWSGAGTAAGVAAGTCRPCGGGAVATASAAVPAAGGALVKCMACGGRRPGRATRPALVCCFCFSFVLYWASSPLYHTPLLVRYATAPGRARPQRPHVAWGSTSLRLPSWVPPPTAVFRLCSPRVRAQTAGEPAGMVDGRPRIGRARRPASTRNRKGDRTAPTRGAGGRSQRGWSSRRAAAVTPPCARRRATPANSISPTLQRRRAGTPPPPPPPATPPALGGLSPSRDASAPPPLTAPPPPSAGA